MDQLCLLIGTMTYGGLRCRLVFHSSVVALTHMAPINHKFKPFTIKQNDLLSFSLGPGVNIRPGYIDCAVCGGPFEHMLPCGNPDSEKLVLKKLIS